MNTLTIDGTEHEINDEIANLILLISNERDDLKNNLIGKTDGGATVPCRDGLCAELSLMLDVFNSCIETKTLPKIGSPCQEKIIELLKRCGKEPTALKVRGA